VAQAISGTGALRIGGAFLARHYPRSKIIYLPVPSWGNHTPLFKDSGLEVRGYRYFDKKTFGLDFAGLKEDLQVCILPQHHSTAIFNLDLMSECTQRCHRPPARLCTQPHWRRPNSIPMGRNFRHTWRTTALPLLRYGLSRFRLRLHLPRRLRR